ncbi:putative integral membrane protein (DUF2270) [Snodgrassella alvi SCGC AB-598-O02]|nr:putative integral membrane protein (DUF2270) [Snodgrassella alvi SCGC AB-598-O02]
MLYHNLQRNNNKIYFFIIYVLSIEYFVRLKIHSPVLHKFVYR